MRDDYKDCSCKNVFNGRGVFVFKDKSNCFLHSPTIAEHNRLLDMRLKHRDQLGRAILLCWLCNKRLTYYNEILNFQLVNLPNGTTVKMHKVCAKDFKEHPDSYE